MFLHCKKPTLSKQDQSIFRLKINCYVFPIETIAGELKAQANPYPNPRSNGNSQLIISTLSSASKGNNFMHIFRKLILSNLIDFFYCQQMPWKEKLYSLSLVGKYFGSHLCGVTTNKLSSSTVLLQNG